MANRSKIVGEVATKVISLHNSGYNPTMIAKEIATAKDTVKKFLIDNNFTPNTRNNQMRQDSYRVFIDMVKNGTEPFLKPGFLFLTPSAKIQPNL